MINRVILAGNLGKNPEVSLTKNGDKVALLSLATSEKWRDKNGNLNEKTEWHRIKMFGRQAEIAEKYLSKGSKVFIEGSLTTYQYTDKNGIERWMTEIKATNMQMMGGGTQQQPQQPQQGYAQQQPRIQQPRIQQNQQVHQNHVQQQPQQGYAQQQPQQGYVEQGYAQQQPQQGHDGFDDFVPHWME